MKNITSNWFKKQNACVDGYKWVLGRTDITVKGTFDELVKINKLEWANWTIVRLLNRKQNLQYVIFAAEQVIDIFEKKYPEDKRPRNAINAVKMVLKKDTKENRAAAYAYSAAAYSAAAYAYASAYAAYASAASASAAAAYASASYAKEMRIKILNYGLSLLGVK